MPLRTCLAAVPLAAVALAASTVAAPAQEWPSQPVKIVVAAAAGGPIDVFGRVMAERLSPLLGQQVVVENVPGAGGMVGGQRVARAEDGHTVLLGTIATHTHSQNLYKQPLYDSRTDFTPVALMAEIPLVLITRKDLPATDMKSFADYAKANQGKMNFGSAGVGSATHLGCELLAAGLGVKVQHVPYRGTGPAMQDLQGGRIDFLCEIVLTAAPQAQAGTVKALATLSAARSAALPNVPTAAEQGFKGMEADTWTAFFLPKGAPRPVVEKLHAATMKVLETTEAKSRLEQLGATIVAPERRSPAYLADFVKADVTKWAAPVKAAGIEPQ
ncbi:MAG TPA: tripartite tricarboxylate transporter substrate binding protein [Beijerinckiaceae bacterium]|jgi:tripartite-type tricarboxylate transporter receptor subunit TctC